MRTPERSYDVLATVYDGLTADHDYERWTTTLERLAARHGLNGRRLLDLACGTGKSFMPFLRRGFTVTACDVSSGMLAEARRKARGRVRLVHVDMRRLPDLGVHDLVTCLDDAINYLASPAELRAAFAGMARSLAPDGVVMFDANTLGVYRTLFARDTCFEHAGCFFALRGEAAPALAEDGPAPLTIEAFEPGPDGSWSRVTSRHRQYHHSDAAIRGALADAGLGCAVAVGQTPDGELHDLPDELAHTKRIYVAHLLVPNTRKEDADASHREARRADRAGGRVHEGQLTDRRLAPATTTPGPAAVGR